ncbi:transmembrane protein 232 isoform X2 [Hyla sarda]|nr:transmembrane protein 232 isoform X2 [Hyla sarda]XP_056393453.1 transmembrane protein 232 isoform X2 [Hyla sarda]XP_056393454.1 transmembrane protein 232 isoform X2 [Hyla sarda]XP_056393455.1 transmembrane protein 232 isoform X2 [Hyla sarda]XP_056393456.1 transmembrane protein 232 isoform X2 [Hyla sarda]XP_056393457.1 transmembrane protein 232 isoform X2 [Hyla sarda]
MPIIKIPVIKKFGIISTKYHNELQKRLLEKTEEGRRRKSKRKPLEVTEEFIKQFNAAEEVEDQEPMLDTARKILHRCKGQSRLHSKGSGHCGNLQLAWTELILIAQCKGKIQEEALDLLMLSLDGAESSQDQIGVLFFIAESVLYRIGCDAAQKPYLFTSEVKLSKVGFLTFIRLYTFYLLGHLQHFEEQKKRLSTYLKALTACETTYQPYPNVLSAMHVMFKVGEIICDLDTSHETKIFSQKQPDLQDKLSLDSRAAEADTFLWHALLIWQHIQNNRTNLHDVSKLLFLLKEHLHQENWLDVLLALLILGDAAKNDIFYLRTLEEIGCEFLTTFQRQPLISTLGTYPGPLDIINVYTMVLAGICLHGATSEIQKHAFIGFQSENTWIMESTEASLNGLLHFNPPNTSDSDQLKWIIHYCTVYNLAKICHELQWDASRDGLKNAICKALDKWRSVQNSTQVLDAEKVAEAEVNGPTNPFISATAKTLSATESLAFFQHVGCRLASALSQQFLPPVVPYIPTPRKPFQKQVPRKVLDVTEHSMDKKTSRLSLRQELVQKGPSLTPPLDFFTRASMDLQKVIEDQWAKELLIQMKEEEEEMKKEKQEKQKKEEEQSNEKIRKREQKLGKTSKPYELPWSVETITHDKMY